MAFGGVATGNIKAHDAATAVPTININGCISIINAKGANTGNNIAVVAKLEVISVRKFTEAINKSTNNRIDKLLNTAI